MKRPGMYMLMLLGLIIAAFALIKCNNSGGARNVHTHADSSSEVGPAPDNNSANNPSLADTNFEKNRTRPITDTMRQR